MARYIGAYKQFQSEAEDQSIKRGRLGNFHLILFPICFPDRESSRMPLTLNPVCLFEIRLFISFENALNCRFVNKLTNKSFCKRKNHILVIRFDSRVWQRKIINIVSFKRSIFSDFHRFLLPYFLIDNRKYQSAKYMKLYNRNKFFDSFMPK